MARFKDSAEQIEAAATPKRVIVKNTAANQYIDGYLVSMIDDNGELFRRAFFPTETDKLKAFIGNLQRANRYLQVKISTVTTLVEFDRGLTTEAYTYTRYKDDQRKTSTLNDMTKIFKK